MTPVGHGCEIGGANDRCIIPPYGIFGGMPGRHGDNHVQRKNGEIISVDRAGGVPVEEGDILYFRAPGGGGYGNPLERDMDYLQHDIDNGLVTEESAERDYGVVINKNTHRIDKKASEEKRSVLKKNWKREDIFIDQYTQPFARKPFRIVKMTDKF